MKQEEKCRGSERQRQSMKGEERGEKNEKREEGKDEARTVKKDWSETGRIWARREWHGPRSEFMMLHREIRRQKTKKSLRGRMCLKFGLVLLFIYHFPASLEFEARSPAPFSNAIALHLMK